MSEEKTPLVSAEFMASQAEQRNKIVRTLTSSNHRDISRKGNPFLPSILKQKSYQAFMTVDTSTEETFAVFHCLDNELLYILVLTQKFDFDLPDIEELLNQIMAFNYTEFNYYLISYKGKKLLSLCQVVAISPSIPESDLQALLVPSKLYEKYRKIKFAIESGSIQKQEISTKIQTEGNISWEDFLSRQVAAPFYECVICFSGKHKFFVYALSIDINANYELTLNCKVQLKMKDYVVESTNEILRYFQKVKQQVKLKNSIHQNELKIEITPENNLVYTKHLNLSSSLGTDEAVKTETKDFVDEIDRFLAGLTYQGTDRMKMYYSDLSGQFQCFYKIYERIYDHQHEISIMSKIRSDSYLREVFSLEDVLLIEEDTKFWVVYYFPHQSNEKDVLSLGDTGDYNNVEEILTSLIDLELSCSEVLPQLKVSKGKIYFKYKATLSETMSAADSSRDVSQIIFEYINSVQFFKESTEIDPIDKIDLDHSLIESASFNVGGMQASSQLIEGSFDSYLIRHDNNTKIRSEYKKKVLGICYNKDSRSLISEYCPKAVAKEILIKPYEKAKMLEMSMNTLKIIRDATMHTAFIYHLSLSSLEFNYNDELRVDLADLKSLETEWQAPEEVDAETMQSTLYRFGEVIYCLLLGTTDLYDESARKLHPYDLKISISAGKRPLIPWDIEYENPEICALIRALWTKNPNKRPDINVLAQIISSIKK